MSAGFKVAVEELIVVGVLLQNQAAAQHQVGEAVRCHCSIHVHLVLVLEGSSTRNTKVKIFSAKLEIREIVTHVVCQIKEKQHPSKLGNSISFYHDLELTLKKSKNPTSGVLPTCFSLSLKKNQPVMPASSSSGLALDRAARWRRSSRLSRPRKNARPVLFIQGGPRKHIPECYRALSGKCCLVEIKLSTAT